METVQSGSVMIVTETETIIAPVIKKLKSNEISVLISPRHIRHIESTLGIQVGIPHQEGREFTIILDPISFSKVTEGAVISFKLKTTVPFRIGYDLIVIPEEVLWII